MFHPHPDKFESAALSGNQKKDKVDSNDRAL